MLIRLLATLFLAVTLAVVIARQSPKRANAWGGVFGGMLMIALGAWEYSGGGISEILLLQAEVHRLRDGKAVFWLMLGYAFVLGSIGAMPWMPPSSASEVGAVLRGDLFSWISWRGSVGRTLRWMLVIAVILLLWRWIGGSYYR